MAANNFKAFATGANANVTSQTEWEGLGALATGFQAGKASSAQINKAIRQSSFITAALAQYVANKTGQDVLDDGNIAGFITKLVSGLGTDFQPLDGTLTSLSGKDVVGILAFLGLSDVVTRSDDHYRQALQSIYNLADLTDKAGARSNLGLSTAAVRDVGTTANTVAAGDDPRITGALQKSGNLYELTDKAGARSNLGLGNSAVLNVGKASSTVAAGDDSRITGALQKTANLADLSDQAGARNNLGLGSAALRSVGTGLNQIPDMSSWETDANSNGHLKLPNGIYIQWYTANLAQGNNTITFPTPFPNFFLADAGMQGLSSTVGGVSATKATRTYYSNAANTACFIAIGL